MSRRRPALVLVCIGSLLACAGDLSPRPEAPSRIPGVNTSYQVTGLAERGEYLDAVFERPGSILRFFFPANDVCRQVVSLEAEVTYKTVSVLGTVENEHGTCQSVGIGSLRTWRDRRPRQSRQVLPRGSAVYREVYQDDELTLLRGRFPYANQIGWVGGQDTLAAVPRTDGCDRIVARGNTTLTYRHSGPDPYRLGSDCVILGFLKPLPQATRSGGSEPEAAP